MHGVSGTPPSELLYTAPVSYDLGPDLAKVYEPNRDEWDVRAFHWGSLTSKSAWTAFWILLAPFAMANVAGWMSESPNIWSRLWIRVAGLSLTGILFAQAANIGLDIPFASGLSHTAVHWLYSGVCVLTVFGLGLLSTQSSFKRLSLGEKVRFLFSPAISSMQPAMKSPAEWDDPANDMSIVGYRMWGIHSIVHRLRRIHLTFGMCVLAVVAARVVDNPAAGTAAIALAGVAMVSLAFTTGPSAGNRVLLGLTAVQPVAGLIILLWGLVALIAGTPAATNVGDDLTFEIALILGVSAGLGLLGELVTSRFRSGWVSLGLLAVATLVGATFGLTGAMLVESYLTSADRTSETFDAGAAFVTVGMLGLALVMAVTLAVAALTVGGDHRGSLIRRAVLRSRVVLGVAGAYGVLFGIVAVILSCTGPFDTCTQENLQMPSWIVEDPGSLVVLLGIPFDPTSLLGWAKVLMVAVPAFLIVRSIVGGLLNGQDSRRQVGILWDLGSFWPRWFHPLAPPAYGPYAVTRLQTVIDETEPDVLSAHSQGSLIAAVAMGLTSVDRVPTSFVTYGSQIGDLYPSLFPAVGFESLVDGVDRQVGGRWLNLWRSSDAVGGQVIEALGARNWEVRTGSGHSRYELTPEFCAARLTALSGELDRPDDTTMADCWRRNRGREPRSPGEGARPEA